MSQDGKGSARLAVFAVLFVALTVGGAAWAVSRSEASLDDLTELGQLSSTALIALLALCVGLYVSDVARYRVLGHAVGEPIGWRAGLDASVANFFFSWLTPGAAFGAPATIYMLRRRGISWEGSALVAFGKSLTGIAFLLCAAFAMLAAGFGPGWNTWSLAMLLPGTAVVAACLAILVIGALWPDASIGAVGRVERWTLRRRLFAGPRSKRVVAALARGVRSTIERLAALRSGGKRILFVLLLTHVIYFSVFVAIGVVLAEGFGADSIGQAIGVTTVYIAFTYVAPTPGGSGLAELAATLFFGGVLPPREAVIVVLLFRALTFYLHIAFGLFYLLVVGGLRDIARGNKMRS